MLTWRRPWAHKCSLLLYLRCHGWSAAQLAFKDTQQPVHAVLQCFYLAEYQHNIRYRTFSAIACGSNSLACSDHPNQPGLA